MSDKKTTKKENQSKEKAWHIAEYYGFQNIEAHVIVRGDQLIAKKIDTYSIDHIFFPKTEEKIALLRTYIETKMHAGPQPVTLYYEGTPHIHGERRKKTKGVYGLEILGTQKSIAEAILIKTASVILTELGHSDLVVSVNTIGDKESMTRYARELATYYKKHSIHLTQEEKDMLKKDPFYLVWHGAKATKTKHIHDNIPESLMYLSDKSRIHFKEVLEYLEHMNVPYRVVRSLIGNRSLSAETVFSIDSISSDGKEIRLAFGTRYASLGKRLEHKKDIPGVGITIVSTSSDTEHKKITQKKKPLFYYIQLGFEAKLKSLELMERLRQANIPIEQSLSKDKLGAQLSMAENLKFPYVLIMGQKEALENSVLVRIMETRSQESVPIDQLVAYLKKLK